MEITADQHFLLLFVFSKHFGSDLKDERPSKSVFQRIVEGLPPYATLDLSDNMIKELDDEELTESSLSRSREMGMGNLRYV
ncbi:hypothetical protein MRB53_010506 [Persea americana]|uniref:Uncharacterized protein n=1 Tax=Persea americana TaxID=3435 RepID=A0ACC2LT70_PERAE|nr:hypothetical protein MRB53_010506 [Persea americana]